MSEVESVTFVTGPFQLVRHNLLTPDTKEGRKGKAAQYADEKFKFTGRFKNNDDLKAFKKAAIEAFRNGMPGADKEDFAAMLKSRFKAGDAIADKAAIRAEKMKDESRKKEWARGFTIVEAKSKFAPEVIDRAGKTLTVADQRRLFPGVELAAEVTMEFYESSEDSNGDMKPAGVTCYVNKAILLNEKVERIEGVGGARKTAAEVFKNLTGGTSTEDLGGSDVEDIDDLI